MEIQIKGLKEMDFEIYSEELVVIKEMNLFRKLLVKLFPNSFTRYLKIREYIGITKVTETVPGSYRINL